MNAKHLLLALLLIAFAPLAHAGYCDGVLHGDSVNDVQVSNCVKLPGTFTFATLPNSTSIKVGTTAYTSDQGTVVLTTSGWVAVNTPGSGTSIPLNQGVGQIPADSNLPNQPANNVLCTGSSPGAPTPCPSAYATAVYAADPPYNVQCVGTDETTTINAALSAAMSANKLLILPSGQCEVTASSSAGALGITHNAHVVGAGILLTRLTLKAGSTGPLFYVNVPSSAVAAGTSGEVYLGDMTITADSETDTSGQNVAFGIGLAPSGSTAQIRLFLDRVKITGMPSDAINATTFNGWIESHGSFVIYNGGRGIYANSVTDWRWFGGEVAGSQLDGLVLSGSSGMQFVGTNFYVNGQSGTGANIKIFNTSNTVFTGIVSDLTAQDGVDISNASGYKGLVFEGSSFKWAGSSANATYSDVNFLAANAENVQFTGAHFSTPASSSSSNKPLYNVNFTSGATGKFIASTVNFDLGTPSTTGVTNNLDLLGGTYVTGSGNLIQYDSGLTINTVNAGQGFLVQNRINSVAQLNGSASGDDNGAMTLYNGGVAKVSCQAAGTCQFNQSAFGIQVGSPMGGDEGNGTANSQNGWYLNGIRTPYVLSQTALPLILPSSGSIGNNGALTGLTALPTTYSSGYMYFPAGAISSGSAAGLYYVVMSGTTAGTIYNNTYTSGTPVVPASPAAFSTTGPGSYTQTTGSFIPLMTATVPAAALGLNGELSVDFNFDVPNNSDTKQCEYTYGGTNFGDTSVTTVSSENLMFRMRNAGSASAQIGSAGTVGSVGTGSIVRGAINSAVAQNVAIQAQLSTATDYVILESYSVKVSQN